LGAIAARVGNLVCHDQMMLCIDSRPIGCVGLPQAQSSSELAANMRARSERLAFMTFANVSTASVECCRASSRIVEVGRPPGLPLWPGTKVIDEFGEQLHWGVVRFHADMP
jgi:hypothetical protein